jgi:hypothetical protein
LLVVLACSRPSPSGVALDGRIREPSGLTASTARPGVMWTHGDSGAANWLFAIDRRGRLLARVRVRGSHNVDWEDLTHDDEGRLWIGDIGNNDSVRRDLRVYRVPEPSLDEAVGTVRVERTVGYHFPDQHEFGDQRADFDAEALFWWQDQLWLLTKHRNDDFTRLYRFPALSGEVALEQVASFDLGASLEGPHQRRSGQVTAAEVAPDGRHWAMLSYDAVFVFATPSSGKGADLFDELVTRIGFDSSHTRQAEALAWDGEALVIVNEDRALFRIEDPLTRTHYP